MTVKRRADLILVMEKLRRVGEVVVEDGKYVAVISEKELHLLQVVNDLDHGRIERLLVTDGQPHFVEPTVVIRQVKL